MLPQEIIRAKRDGETLADDDIAAFVRGVTDGSVSRGAGRRVARWPCTSRGCRSASGSRYMRAMTTSGTVLQWALDGPVVDKHSTGGVGDTVSLMLAPAVAACGAYVPMISGRGSATPAARTTSSRASRATWPRRT